MWLVHMQPPGIHKPYNGKSISHATALSKDAFSRQMFFNSPALKKSSIQCHCVVYWTGWCSVERLWCSCWPADVSATVTMPLMTWCWACVSMLYEFLLHTVPCFTRYTHTFLPNLNVGYYIYITHIIISFVYLFSDLP